MAFDLEAARKDGVSDLDIASALAAKNNYDLGAALKDKVPLDNILSSLLSRENSKGEYDVAGGLKDLGRTIVDIPTRVKGALSNLLEDENPRAQDTTVDRWRRDDVALTKQRQEEVAAEGGDPESKVIPAIPYVLPSGIKRKDIQELGPNSGFSSGSLVAGAAGGLTGRGVGAAAGGAYAGPVGAAIGGKVGQIAGGMVASFGAGWKMDKTQITNAMLDALDETLQRPANKAEVDDFLARTKSLRNNHALWEAAPEAIGNVAQLAGIGAVFESAMGKGLAKNAMLKFFGSQGVEVGTETVTQVGQHNTEIDMGLKPGEAKRSFSSPEDVAKSYEEVAPATLLLGGVHGGAAYGAGKVASAVKNAGKNDPAQKDYRYEPETPTFDDPPASNIQEQDWDKIKGGMSVTNDLSNLGPLATIAENAIGREQQAALEEAAYQEYQPAVPDVFENVDPVTGEIFEPESYPDATVEGEVAPQVASVDEVLRGLESVIPRESQRAKEGMEDAPEQGGMFPEGWFRDSQIRKFDAQHGTGHADKIKPLKILSTLRSYLNGRPLNETQRPAWDFIRDYAGKQFGVEVPEFGAITTAAKAHEAATSPLNNIPQPTEAQKEAGNYQKGHTSVHGLDISIENPAGSERSGTDKSGKAWSIPMRDHYGYIKRTVGKDKDHLDVFVNPARPESDTVFVVDQVSPATGTFDEHKILFGFDTEDEARAGYLRNYEPGWKGLGTITGMPVEQFKEWTKSGKTMQPMATGEGGISPDPVVSPGEGGGTSDSMNENSPDASDASAPSGVSPTPPAVSTQAAEPVSATAPAKSPTFTIESLREKSILVKGDSKEIVAKLQEAGVRANGIPNTGRGGMVYAKKHEAKIRAALETQKETPNAQTDTADTVAAVSKASKPADLVIKSLETGKETVLTAEKQEENSAKITGDSGKVFSGKYNNLKWSERRAQAQKDFQKGNPVPEEVQKEHPDLVEKFKNYDPNAKAADVTPSANAIFTEDMYQAARERMRARLNRPNAGLDPEMVQDGIIMAGFHIEHGARTFGAYAKAMIADMGEAVKPYLKSWYMAAKFDPRLAGTDGLSSAADVEGADVDKIVADNGAASLPDKKIDKVAGDADNISKGKSSQPEGEGNEHRGAAKQSQEALGEVVSEDGGGHEEAKPVRQADAGSSETGTAPDRPTDEGGVSAPRSGRSRAQGRNTHPAGKPGRGRRGVAREEGDALTEPPNIPAANFTITEDVRLGKGGESEKFRDNISAIETLKKIELEARRATPEEQKTLARYVGWGGLANAFANPIDGKVKDGWADRVKQLSGLLDEKELAAARNSTQNAHYTSPVVISAMWDAMRQLGVKGGISLEPSAGVGNFIGMAPEDMAGMKFVGVEYDSTTARIAKALYPQASIIHSGFQKVPVPSGAFDLVIGNPPFGKESLTFRHNPAISRFSIHNQFFLAGIDALKPGGIQAMVVSRYLLDAKDSSARLALAKKADLLGAIRLPDTAFKENARAEVVTDIIFLQKHFYDLEAKRFDAHGEEMPPIKFEAPAWVETATIPDPLGGEAMTVNNYFVQNPKAIIGTMERSGSMQHGADITVRLDKGNDLAALLGQKIKDVLPENVVKHTPAAETIAKRFEDMRVGLEIAMAGHEPGNVSINADGKLEHITEKENAQGDWEMTRRVITPSSPWSPQLSMNEDGKWFREVVKLDENGNKVKSGRLNVYTREVFDSEKDVPASLLLGQAKYDRLVELVKIRDLLREQINLEIGDRAAAKIEGNRKGLKAAYDAYVKANGFISDGKNASLVSEMPDGALVLSLENSYKKAINPIQAKRTNSNPRKASAKQAAILSERVVFKQKPMEKADSPADAILISLSESGTVDMVRIAQLLGISEETAVAKLHDDLANPLIFHNPETGGWEQADEYLTGQVVKKMAAAKAAGLTKNARALEKVIPEQWGPDKVTPVIGASWIPAEDYSDFVAHLTGALAKVRYSKIANSYAVTGNGSAPGGIQWRTEHADAIFLVNALLNSSSVNIYWTDSDGKRHLNQEASELAAMKAAEIESEFTDWAFADSDRRNRLVQKFNDKFNTRVPRQRDGSHMTLPGKVPDIFIKMRRHQMNAIWRGVVDRFTLYDHAVGAGKTFTAIARSMERKRMGVSRKPMIVVPNHLVEQFAADVYRLYPGANLLAASKKDFEKKNRRRLFAKIATGNWDIVIVPHSSFKAIGISQEAEERFLEQDLKAAQDAVAEAEEQAAEDGEDQGFRKPHNVKMAEKMVSTITEKIERLKGATRDKLLSFEQLGVDDLTVDEAHEFKNLWYSSRLSVRGMNPKLGSEKAYDLYNKVRVLRDSPTGSVTFMTGTPISNSAVEMYGLMRYLAADELNDLGLDHFDAWRAQYTSVTSKFEPTESGNSLKEVKRLGRDWVNMRALMDLYYSFTDAVTNEDIKQWYAEDNEGAEFPIPKVTGGERKAIVVQPTKAQQDKLADIIAGFEALPNERNPKIRNANRLRLMDRARKVSLDVRAVDPRNQSVEEGGKLEVAANEVARIYQKWTKDKGTQLVFLDRSIPKTNGDLKIIKAYDELVGKMEAATRAGDEEALRKVEEKLEKYDANEIAEMRTSQSGGWNAYQQIKDNLVSRGIPANEIRFIQEANNDTQKKNLFEMVNSGEVRVLIGSTPRMGAGTNVQERLVGLHHVDVTYKPSDIEQREGRIIRQGNSLLDKYGPGFEVEIMAYVTERTIDAKMWDLNSTKLKMINGIRKYDGEFTMEFEDEDSVGMAEIAALASGNPLQLERVKLAAEIDRLERAEKGHRRQKYANESNLADARKVADKYPAKIETEVERQKTVSEAAKATEEDARNRKVVLNGKTYETSASSMEAMKVLIEAKEEAKEKGAAPFLAEIDGKLFKSYDKAADAVAEKLGDRLPFLATMGKEKFIQRVDLARAIAKNINAKLDMIQEGNEEITVAEYRMNGAEVKVSAYEGHQKRIEIRGSFWVNGQAAGVDYTSMGADAKAATVVHTRPLVGLMEDGVESIAGGKNLAAFKKKLKNATEEIPALEQQAAKPFAKAAELAEKRERLEEVIKELSTVTGSQGIVETADLVQLTEASEEGRLNSKATTKTGTTTAQVETELRTFLGKGYDKLTGSGKLRVVQSVAELPGGMAAELRSMAEILPRREADERSYYGYADGRSKGMRVWMTPDEFLSLAAPSIGDAERRAGEMGKFDNEKFNKEFLPYLQVERDGQVVSHEGRARAVVAKNSGIEKLPVTISMYNPVADVASFPQTLTPEHGGRGVAVKGGVLVSKLLYSKDGSIAGTYDPRTGQITLVADNIKAGDAEYVMDHEGLHALMREDAIFIKNHNAILDQFEKLKATDYRVQDAFRRVPEDTAAHLVREEALAYFIENKANHETSLFKKIIANIRMWLMRMGIPMKNLTTDDLVALVTQGVHRMANQDMVADERAVGDLAPALYSKAASLENLEEVAKTMGSITVKKRPKADSTFIDRIFSTPEYYFKKFEAAGRVLQAALLRRDVRFTKEQEILGKEFVGHVQALRKNNREAYDEANNYLIELDQSGEGFSLKEEDETWKVIGPDGKMISRHDEESQAVAAMVGAEAAQLEKNGYSKDAIKAVALARELTNRGFDVMAADMRKIIAEAKEAGLPNPLIGDGTIDEAGRYGIYGAHSKKPIALFATEQQANEAMERAAQMISYVVQIKGGGERSFMSEIKANAWAKKHSGTVNGRKTFGGLTVRMRTDVEMRPLTVQQALAQMGDMRGTYFPRIRKPGEYTLIAKKDGENPIRKSFDLPMVGDDKPTLQKLINSMTPMGREASRLKAQGYDVSLGYDESPVDDMFSGTNLTTTIDAILQDSMAVIDKNNQSDIKAGQQINQLITMQVADIFKARGYLSSRLKRMSGDVVWEGYETDMGKALTQYGKGIAAGTAKRDTARAMVLAFSGRDYSWDDYKQEVDKPVWSDYQEIVEQRRIDPRRQKNLFVDVRGFMIDVLRNDEKTDRIIGTMKGLAVLKFLAFRVSSAAVNATNMVTGVPATLAGHAEISLGKAGAHISKAVSSYAKYRTGKGEMSEADRGIFQEITDRGWDDAQFNQEAARELRGELGEAWNKIMTAGMFMFGAVEKANRATTIFAAYKAVQEKSPGMSPEQIWTKAKEVSDRAHGVYGKETRPAWTRGGDFNRLLALPYTFTKFSHNYMLNMIDLGYTKKEYTAAAYLLISPAILSGAGATLATPVLMGLASALGIGGDDPEEEYYKWAEKTFGTDAFARHGLAGGLLGINLKGSLQINNPMPTKLSELGGAPGAIVTDAWKAIQHLGRGEIAKGAETLLPTAIGSMSKATREATEGITTSNYGQVFYGDEPLKADSLDAALRFFSFNPARLSGIREKQWNEKEVAAKYAERKKEIYSKIKRLQLQGKGITPEVNKEIVRYNDLAKGSGRSDIKPITPKNIRLMLKLNSRASKFERDRE